MDKRTILGRLPLYTDASPALQSKIVDAASSVSLGVGETFYGEGDVLQVFAIVGAGDIRVFKSSPSGREITLYHVQAGESCLVNMLCVFLDRPAMASARTEMPTQAVVIPAPVFRAWIRTEDSVRGMVFATMASRLVDVMTLVEEVAFRKMDLRLAELLARRFSKEGLVPGVVVTTHEELAAELGTVREVVSRLLKDLERIGVITIGRGRIELRDDTLLRRMVSAS